MSLLTPDLSSTAEVLIHYRIDNDSGIKTLWFAPADTGMVIAAIQGSLAQLGVDGHDPTKLVIRSFLTPEYAEAWVKSKCREILGRQDLTFRMEAVSSRLVVPGRHM